MNQRASSSLPVGIIGVGRIGSLHAETLTYRVPNAEVVAIADIDRPVADRVASRLGIPNVSPDYTDLLNRADIAAILICTPTDTHAEIMQATAAAGKHIFVEKPIALDLGEVDEALETVERAGVHLQVGLNRRFDPTYARVRRAISEGELGDVHLLHIISRDPEPPPLDYIRASGGLFADMTIHDLDMARFLLGSEVTSVYAKGAVRIDPAIGQAGDIDTAVLMLTFANGALGTIENSRRAVYGYDQRAEVLGSRGAVSTDNVYANQVTFFTQDGIHRDLPLHFFMERYAESYALELQAFVEAILMDRLPSPDGKDGRIALQLAMAARLALETGHPVDPARF